MRFYLRQKTFYVYAFPNAVRIGLSYKFFFSKILHILFFSLFQLIKTKLESVEM
jgi:hypothetical protein